WSRFSKIPAPWNTPSSSLRRLPNPLPCSTFLRTQHAPWASFSATTDATRSVSTTIFPSTPPPIAKFRFCSAVLPAVNVGLSVSRVGGSAQIKAMRQVAGTLKLELAQYRELAAFAQFGSDLDKATQAQLNRGKRLVELLKQGQFSPLPFSKQILIIFAGTSGVLDDMPVEQVRDFEKDLYKYVETTNPGLLNTIMEKKILDDNLKADLSRVIKEAKQQFVDARQAVK